MFVLISASLHGPALWLGKDFTLFYVPLPAGPVICGSLQTDVAFACAIAEHLQAFPFLLLLRPTSCPWHVDE